MPTLIWGAGAMGGSIGALLARAGHDVVLVDRVPEHVAAIETNGLRIVGPIVEETIRLPARRPETLEGRFGRPSVVTQLLQRDDMLSTP